MAKKQTIKYPYTVRVRKLNRIVDGVLGLIFLIIAVVILAYALMQDASLPQKLLGSIAVVVLGYIALWHYPHYLFEKIEVNENGLTFHQVYFRRHTVSFKEIEDIYFDGKGETGSIRSNGTHAVIIDYGKGKYRVPCDMCDDWETLKKDFKQRGIAVKR